MKKNIIILFLVSLVLGETKEYFYDFEKSIENWKEGEVFKRTKIGKYGPKETIDSVDGKEWFVGIPSTDKTYDETGIISDWLVSPEIDLKDYEHCFISFEHWGDFEESFQPGHYDGGMILINTEENFPDDKWRQIDEVVFNDKEQKKYPFPPKPTGHLIPTYPDFVNVPEVDSFHLRYAFCQDTAGKGKGGEWMKITSADLIKTGYCKKGDKVKFGFCFFCNSNKGGGQGWYIDNFLVTDRDISPPMIEQITELPNTFKTGPYEIRAKIFDTTEIKEVKLYYDCGQGLQFVKMETLDGENFKAEIPFTQNNTLIKYYLYAKDTNGNENKRPYYEPYLFKVLPSEPNPSILLVNDDPCFGRRCEREYFNALEKNNFTYDYIFDQTPTTDDLKKYNLVIWFTAIQGGEQTYTTSYITSPNPYPLSLEEQEILKNYLNSSQEGNIKKLFLTGQKILKGLEEDFLEKYLHIIQTETIKMPEKFTGCDDLTYKFVWLPFETTWWPYEGFQPMKIQPDSNAKEIFKGNFGIRYPQENFENNYKLSNYKLIILPFEFSFIKNSVDEKEILEALISFLKPPLSPKVIKARVSDKEVFLSWLPVLNKPWIKYHIYKSNLTNQIMYPIIDTIDKEYLDKKVETGCLYNYKIKTVDFSGEESEDQEIKVKPDILPASPKNLYFTIDGIKVNLNWDKDSDVKGYYIYRKEDKEAPFVKIGEVFNSCFIDENVFLESQYFYVVTSHKTENEVIGPESGFSNEVTLIKEKINLSNIKVIPNPCYEREIKFINLPKRARIRIYTLNGCLVKLIEYEASMLKREKSWSLENLSSGVYLYYLEGWEDNKEITSRGKFVVIK